MDVFKLLMLAFCMITMCNVIVSKKQGKKQKPKTDSGTKKKIKKEKDWSKINLDEVEKEWESGDERFELENEYERIKRVQQSKLPRVNMQEDGSMKGLADMVKKDPLQFSGGGGGAMIFVDLLPKMPSGAEWKSRDIDILASKWAHLIRTGGSAATVYNIDVRNILVNIERAWMTKDIMKFLSMQPEVESFTLQNKKYTKADFSDDDDDDL